MGARKEGYMSNYFAYTKATRPTGRILAELLGFETFGIKQPTRPLDVLLRWGSRKQMPRARRVLNQASAIALASDKVAAIASMKSAGINCVPCFTTWEQAVQASRGRIILGRTRHGHSGKGIVIYDPASFYEGLYPEQPTEPDEWYTIYHEPTREVRVHVVGDQVVRVQGKYLDFPEQAESNPFMRNWATGYRFRTPRRDLRSRRKEIAIEAVRNLGLNFGAVDMLLFGTDRKAMVLEVNTAPSCSPMTAAAYAEALTRVIER
jgi:glutathione synthase/RimK-type ligase-like ATP-grasp enzyme